MKINKENDRCLLPGKPNHNKTQTEFLRSICKFFGSLLIALLFLTAVNSNANAQAADNFNPNANGIVESMVRQPDGKILIGGTFTTIGGQARERIARVNSDGTLDTTFLTSCAALSCDSITGIAVQTDGKILVGGRFFPNGGGQPPTFFARLNADGTPDNSFNNPNPNNAVKAITVLADGKILIGGTFTIFGTGSSAVTRQYIARLNSDGSLDGVFNPIENWQVSNTSGGGGAGGVHRIIQQPDGKILIGGWFYFYYSPTNFSRYGIARLNTDGTFDSFQPAFQSFLTSGVYDMKLLPDGKIIAGGGFQFSENELGRRIARINADGTLDSTFNAMFQNIANNVDVATVALQPDGKILVGGQFNQIGGQPRDIIAQLNPNGTADSFSSNTFGRVYSIIVQPDGKILVGGNFSIMSGQPRKNIARLYSSELGEGTQPILFITNRDGNNEIYRMNVDGSNQQRLTNTPENEVFTIWSPDGSKILFTRQISTNVRQIWTMNADGSNQTRISPETIYATLYRYSPNGQKILFARSPGVGTDNLWVMNADGSNAVQLTNNTSMIDHFAEWSPDGDKIAYGHCTPQFVCDIYTMNADGSNQINLTADNPTNDDDNPKWTKDGSRIVYGRISNDRAEPYIMDANGGNKQALGNFGSQQYSYPQKISPDGNKVALDFSDGSTLTSREIYTVGINGGTPINITNNNVFDVFNAWSPDSAKIAFRSRRDTATDEIYTMNADGSNVVRLTFNTAVDFVADWFTPRVTNRAPFDFDSDGKTDIGIFRPSGGEWWINSSLTGMTVAAQFGSSSDKLVPGDYTGDGKVDIAFWRPSNGFWYILRSEDASFYGYPFGSNGDIPVPADYDGDGKTDSAVFRPSNNGWYIQKSSGGIEFLTFGSSSDSPVVADYDGDGKSDIAITRINGGSREWWVRRSSDGQVFALTFGESADKAVQGDYTGDGKTDIAVFRPSNGYWYILRSEDNSYYGFPFGISSDIPTPGDFDGDGKFDPSIFRSSNSGWYQMRSTQGFTGITFGLDGDVPIPSAFVP